MTSETILCIDNGDSSEVLISLPQREAYLRSKHTQKTILLELITEWLKQQSELSLVEIWECIQYLKQNAARNGMYERMGAMMNQRNFGLAKASSEIEKLFRFK